MAVATLAIIVILFYSRLVVVGDLALGWTVFWIVWPDLGAFIPIGLAARGTRSRPTWGPPLYNAMHPFLLGVPVFVIWGLVQGRIEWPLLG